MAIQFLCFKYGCCQVAKPATVTIQQLTYPVHTGFGNRKGINRGRCIRTENISNIYKKRRGKMDDPFTIWTDDLVPGMSARTIVKDEQRVIEFDLMGHAKAIVGVGRHSNGKKWATIYEHEAENDLQEMVLLQSIFYHYKVHGFDCGYSFAGTTKLKGILYRIGLKEREEYKSVYDLEKDKTTV